MKLASAAVVPFLRRPDPQVRAVLCYGPDAGLVQERATTVALAVCPDLHDPFRVADLPGTAVAADPARLADEAAQIAFTGGRRVIRVRDAGDALAPIFERWLDNSPGDGFVVVDAGDLPSRSALRRVFEQAPDTAAIPCYPDGRRELGALIRDTLAARRVTASRDAVTYLIDHLGGDRLLTRGELDKLALYAGEGGNVELADAQICVSDSAVLSLDDAVMAAAEGNANGLDRALTRVFLEGTSPVSVIRALLRHGQRLHALSAQLAGGMSVDAVLRAARPPIFFKQQTSFRHQLERWSEPGLRTQLVALANAELAMKRTGAPAEAICREAMLAMAGPAKQR
jgi:DNA polymerase III subunit delta